MKKIWSKIPLPQLTSEHKELLLGLVLTLVVASLYYAQWGYYLTSVTDSKVSVDFPQKYFWWADDSRDYRLTGDWLFGRANETVILVRPWVYPFVVGLARALLGAGAEKMLWLSQFGMWLASASLLYLAIYNASRKIPLAILGATLFFSHPSPLVLTFHGMTETLNLLLLCLLAWLFSIRAANRYRLALFTLSLLTATKPTYQLQLALFVGYLGWLAWQKRERFQVKTLGWVFLALAPIWIQFAITFSYNRTLTLSTIGPHTFKNYFVAIVYQRIENKEWRPSMTEIENWDTRQQLTYLWEHQRETLLTYRRNLIDTNQWIGSFFIRGEDNRMIGFVETINGLALYLHLFMLPLMFYALFSGKLRENQELILLIYAVFLIQTLATGISTGQEDRLTVTGVPLWIIAYLLTLKQLFSAPQPDPVD